MESRPFFPLATIAFGVFILFLPFAITVFRGPEGYFSVAILAFGAFELIVPKQYYRLGKMDKRRLDSLIFKEVRVVKGLDTCGRPTMSHSNVTFVILLFNPG